MMDGRALVGDVSYDLPIIYLARRLLLHWMIILTRKFGDEGINDIYLNIGTRHTPIPPVQNLSRK